MFSFLDSAIRTIFSSTDTVCTLQVLDFLKEYLCPEIPSSQACMFTRFYNIHANITYSPSR